MVTSTWNTDNSLVGMGANANQHISTKMGTLSLTDCTRNEEQSMCASKQILYVSFMRVCVKLLQSLHVWSTYYTSIYTTQSCIVTEK